MGVCGGGGGGGGGVMSCKAVGGRGERRGRGDRDREITGPTAGGPASLYPLHRPNSNNN